MSFYDYRCTSPTCNHAWESEHPITQDPITTCPACKQETAKRQVSTGTMTGFKGKWFKTGGY